MSYAENIKEGFRLVNRNWPLVVIQFVMAVIGCVGFFVIVGIPLLAAVMALGLNVSELTKLSDFLVKAESPLELLKEYLAVGLVVVVAVLVYLGFAVSLWLYVFGASAGVLGRALSLPGHRFALREFYSDGRRLFFPLLWYTSLVGLIFLGGFVLLGVLGGILPALKFHETTFGLFLSVFFALLAVVAGILLTAASVALALFGTGLMVFRGGGASQTLRGTLRFLRERPSALGLFAVAAAGYVLVYFVFVLMALPFNLIPVVGPVLLLPYQLFLYALQGYLNLVLMAVVVSYIHSTFSSAAEGPRISGEVPVQGPPQGPKVGTA